MYLLMNKDNIVATFEKKPETELSISVSFKINETFGKLPYGFENINTWLDGRKSSKHNKHLAELMKRMGCYDNEGFIQVTHAATINDTFWIKSEKESLSWEQISLYRNQFTKTISRLAFEGVGLYDTIFSSTSPELACEGSFRKCFRKENEIGEWGSDIFIYKRGSEGASNAGLEPYCEAMASEIAQVVCSNSVSYKLAQLHGKLASRCNLFTSEEYGYIPFAKLANVKNMSFEDTFRFFAEHGAEEQFREMLILDSLCFNEDRHAGNFGMLFNNDTMELGKMSPVFDLNISLFAYAYDKDLTNIGDLLYVRSPKLGEDFTRMGQIACTDIIRDKIKDMKDFSFSFRGDDVFSKQRVKNIEYAIRRQAEAVLSKDKLFTRNAFFSQKAENETEQQNMAAIRNELVDGFMDVLETLPMEKEAFVSDCKSLNTSQCYVEKNDFMLTIDFVKGEIIIEDNLQLINFKELKAEDPQFYKTCKDIHKELCQYMKKCGDKSFCEYFKTTDMEIDCSDERKMQ